MDPGSVPDTMIALTRALQGQTIGGACFDGINTPSQRNSAYTASLSLRSVLVVLTAAHDAAPRLISLQRPLRDHFGGAASLWLASSPIAFNLGRLHRLLGDEAAAQREFAHAETVARRWQSPFWERRAAAAASGAGIGDLGPA